MKHPPDDVLTDGVEVERAGFGRAFRKAGGGFVAGVQALWKSDEPNRDEQNRERVWG